MTNEEKPKNEEKPNQAADAETSSAALAELLASARHAARASSQAYLQQARSPGNDANAEELEAIAIKRALVADQISEIARQNRELKLADPAHAPANENCQQADHRLLRDCERLLRVAPVGSPLRKFARDLQQSLAGLGLPQGNYSRSSAGPSISM